ncbi:MAG: PDDEXK nuclease domain-containing protein [Sulfurimonas sp.]|nr:PDDEXK nuclease domain-containing protein [Sulfurimonas sp.]
MANIAEYTSIFSDLKERILSSQQKAIYAVNKELVLLYWDIGNIILKNQSKQGWGAKIIDTLSDDLKKTFPRMKGFSVRNLKYMRQFASTYSEISIVQELLAQLSWYHNLTLIQKLKDDDVRTWYIYKTIENGWSQSVLVHQIESDLYARSTNKKITNFTNTLASPHSELVQETLKDPYLFDFILLSEKAKEKDIEEQLVKHITKFLLELGSGFAFVGNQYKIETENKEYYIDLLFYHLKLKCYFVIELKNVEFKPEFAGKLNFYLSAVDDLVKSETDNPTIGLILCKSKDKIEAEYSLRDINKPIGISEYQITKSIPNELKSNLPSIKEIEEQLENDN